MKNSSQPTREVWELPPEGLPLPTPRFRHRSWIAFQRALDPLAPPKALPATPSTRRDERA